jgi:c-di-GMP-related signal transduction protein
VRHGITLLGERELVRWIRMATTLIMGQEKCSDLVLASLVRAHFCQLIAPKVNHGSCDLFLIGMFSLMDAILEVPMGVVIEGLAFDAETRTELLGIKTGKPTALSPNLRSDGVARGRRVGCGSQTREEAQPVFALCEPGV